MEGIAIRSWTQNGKERDEWRKFVKDSKAHKELQRQQRRRRSGGGEEEEEEEEK